MLIARRLLCRLLWEAQLPAWIYSLKPAAPSAWAGRPLTSRAKLRNGTIPNGAALM